METRVKIFYDNVDITENISENLIDFSYSDKTSGESDELSIKLFNKDGIWGLEWYPEKGAALTAEIHDSNNKILQCGTFSLDETDLDGGKDSGETISIKALGAGIKEGSRTILSHANEKKTLKNIAEAIASKYNWSIIGDVPDIKLGYSVQHRETDLHYLARIASEFGVIFSVRNNTIIFTSIFDLENQNAVKTFAKTDLIHYSIRDKTVGIYLEATSEHYNANEKRLVQFTTPSGKVITYASKNSNNYLNIKTRAENEQQADLISKASIYRENSLQQEGNIAIPGNVAIVAGVNIVLTGLGQYSGNYHVIGTTHKVSKNGSYTTDAEIKKVGLIAYEQQKEQQADAGDNGG